MKRILGLFFGLYCIAAPTLYAQKAKVQNQPYGDQKLYHFGITVGLNFQDMILTNSGLPSGTETWYATIPAYSPGFSVGLLGDLYLNSFMNLRFTPSLHFGDRNYVFVEPETKQTFTADIRSNYLLIPVDLKIRSRRVNNYRPYVITGAYGALDIGRQKDKAVLLRGFDYGLTIGFGCDFYLPIIKIAPELRFSFGLPNSIEGDRSDLTDKSLQKFSDAITKGTTRMITLTLNFE